MREGQRGRHALGDELRVEVLVLPGELGHHLVVHLRDVLRRRLLVVVDEAAAPLLGLGIERHRAIMPAMDGALRSDSELSQAPFNRFFRGLKNTASLRRGEARGRGWCVQYAPPEAWRLLDIARVRRE